MTVIRSINSIAAKDGLKMYQIDVKTAFLISKFEDKTFIEQPCSFLSGEISIFTVCNKQVNLRISFQQKF